MIKDLNVLVAAYFHERGHPGLDNFTDGHPSFTKVIKLIFITESNSTMPTYNKNNKHRKVLNLVGETTITTTKKKPSKIQQIEFGKGSVYVDLSRTTTHNHKYLNF